MPTTRACAMASQARLKPSTPPTKRTARGIFGQPATPARSKNAPPSTQAAPVTSHSMGKGWTNQPACHAAPHKATQTPASSTDPVFCRPLRRPHSQPAAAIMTSATAQNGTGDG